MPPLNGSVLLELNPQFTFQVIDILLGGTGDRRHVNKEFTDIDKNIIRQIASGIIANMKLAWEDVLEVVPELETIETNPAINQTLAPNEPVALITLSVELGKTTTFINLCIPYLSIEKVIDKLVVQYWFQPDNDSALDESKEKMKKSLDSVEVDLAVELGKTHVSVEDFLRLNTGDVIKLDERYNSPVKVIIENEECYFAKPGVVGKNMGVAILDIIDKDVDNYE